MYRLVYTMFSPCTNKNEQKKSRSSWYIPGIYTYILFFHIFSCTYLSIWPECAATSAPPRPALPPVSALKRSMSRLGPATSWRGRGGAAGPAPDVCHQPPGRTEILYCNSVTMEHLILTQLAKWLWRLDAVCEILGLNPKTNTFFLPF